MNNPDKEQIAPIPETAEVEPQTEEKRSQVPTQYQGLPSEVVEELWQNPIYVDQEKNVAETQRREAALAEIKEQETLREQQKAQADAEKFSLLSEDQRKEFPNLQQSAASMVAEHIKGTSRLDDKLTTEESFVLDKVENAWKKAQEKDPNAPITFELGREVDKQVYANLLNKLAFDEIKGQKVSAEQQRIEEIRQELGMPTQKVENNQPNIPEKENVQRPEQIETTEKEAQFKDEIEKFLETVNQNPDIRRMIDNFRSKTGSQENDLAIISKMSGATYDLIHKSGLEYKDIIDGINVPNKDEFVSNFSTTVGTRLVEAVQKSSKVRPITEKELIDGGQPDQAAGFVWFKGNAPRPENAREVRFYIDARPEGVTNVAEYLGKVSDICDQYGLRLQFKFRKDIGEYDRTDTCVAYLYVPEAKDAGQKANSDQWVEQISKLVSEVPKDAVKEQTSLFTNKLAKGIASVEDTREESSKKGESYTSQITKTIAEACGDVAGKYSTLDEKAMAEISEIALQKLKQLKYVQY